MCTTNKSENGAFDCTQISLMSDDGSRRSTTARESVRSQKNIFDLDVLVQKKYNQSKLNI